MKNKDKKDKEIKEALDEPANLGNDAEEKDALEIKDEQVQALEKQNADYLDRLQRTMAEFDNFRKRTVKEKASMYDDGVIDTVSQILPAIDNFERAFNAYSGDQEDSFYTGIQMILKQILEILEGMGVSAIETKGAQFNPNMHSAMMHIEDDAFGESEIVEELQKGYQYKDKVIRPSMVKVAN